MALTATYTVLTDEKVGGRTSERMNPREKRTVVQIVIPGAETYGTGLALSTTPSDYGLIRNLNRLEPIDLGSDVGEVWKHDFSAFTMRAYKEADALGAMAELAGGDTPGATEFIVAAYGW